MLVMYLLGQLWAWIATTGLNLAIIVVIAFLIPRLGRFAERLVEREVAAKQNNDEQKASLAFAGVGIYVAQIVGYFLLSIAFLSELGFSLAGAAIPATVVSAAIGFGAQSIIADFLAGFFILSEKQYGVGDWVRFQGNGVEVEGSVISITMRSTTIRTLAQETITIPNSTARVCINTSNFWSRAVIVMPVPLLGSKSVEAVVTRVKSAADKALANPDIASDLIGELDVQPATSVTPPATVGMPWTMDVRLLVQVEAGEQWAVERAVRMAVLDEFWDEYGSATTISGELRDTIARPTATGVSVAPTPKDDTSTATWRVDSEVEAPAENVAAVVPEQQGQGEGENPVPASRANPDGSDPAGAPLGDSANAADEPVHNGPEDEATTPEELAPAATRWQRIRVAVKETRPSTLWILGVLGLLLVVKLLTFSTEGEDGERIAGIFAPPGPNTGEASATSEPTPEETAEPTSAEPTDSYTSEQPTPTTAETVDPRSPNEYEEPSEPTPQAPDATVPDPPTDSGAPAPDTGGDTGAGANGAEQTVQPQSSEANEAVPDTPDTGDQSDLN